MKTTFPKWTMGFTAVLLICMVALGQTPSQRTFSEIAAAALQSDKNAQIGLVAGILLHAQAQAQEHAQAP
jgi:hypothetical protein